ncbi:hypothetical protein Q3G72_001238 [Acer saccharum]|nr:hypothetical protein Q3G72_001238 [Acer saccharum]
MGRTGYYQAKQVHEVLGSEKILPWRDGQNLLLTKVPPVLNVANAFLALEASLQATVIVAGLAGKYGMMWCVGWQRLGHDEGATRHAKRHSFALVLVCCREELEYEGVTSPDSWNLTEDSRTSLTLVVGEGFSDSLSSLAAITSDGEGKNGGEEEHPDDATLLLELDKVLVKGIAHEGDVLAVPILYRCVPLSVCNKDLLADENDLEIAVYTLDSL